MNNLLHPIAALLVTALAHYYGHGLIGASIVSAFFVGREPLHFNTKLQQTNCGYIMAHGAR